MAKNAEDYRLPPGWSRQQVQLPTPIAEEFKKACVEEGHGGVKLVSTAAIALFLGVPKEVRDALVEWVAQNSRKQLDQVTPANAWEISEPAFGHLFPEKSNIKLVAGRLPDAKRSGRFPPAKATTPTSRKNEND